MIAGLTVRVTVEIGRTQLDTLLATKSVRPSGLLMIEFACPASIGRPTLPVPTEIGVTAPAGAVLPE
jgi:hypothetical protein